MSTAPSDYPFESFNARALSPRQVADGFVPPESFRALCKRRHTIVAGPRGSGKTTLLKMLQVSSLRLWDHAEANELRSQVDFTGVFIPADRCWGEQIAAIGGEYLSSDQRRLFGVAAFTTQVLRALVASVIERCSGPAGVAQNDFRGMALSPEDEVSLVRNIAPGWELNVSVPTLLSLKSSLMQRLSEIHKLASSFAFLERESQNRIIVETKFLHLNFLSAVPLFLDHFESVTGKVDERWALMFDELELAPESIRTMLAQALRSVDSRLIFKLSIAPFSRELEESIKAASERNDYDLVRLWYPSKEDGYPFSRSLILHLLKRRGIEDKPLEAVFGTTDYDVPPPDRKWPKGQGYGPIDVFRRLANGDATFRTYLQDKKIDLNSVSELAENKRAALIRKITPLVLVREAYRRKDEELSTPGLQRSRKSNKLYCGVPAILAVCEGNPRWLIGLVDNLVAKRDSSGRVDKHHQDQEISSLLSRFTAFLRTIPCRGFDRDQLFSVHVLIDKIGSSFNKAIVTEPFNADPPGTFTVDSSATEEQLRSLEQAVYAGAIIFVPESASEIAVGSLRGKRFRLAYLLAPKYHLPMILLRSLSLSLLLKKDHGKPEDGAQKVLF